MFARSIDRTSARNAHKRKTLTESVVRMNLEQGGALNVGSMSTTAACQASFKPQFRLISPSFLQIPQSLCKQCHKSLPHTTAISHSKLHSISSCWLRECHLKRDEACIGQRCDLTKLLHCKLAANNAHLKSSCSDMSTARLLSAACAPL